MKNHHRHRVPRTAVAGVALAGLMLPATTFAKRPVPPIEWETCGPDFPAVECATYKVPLDYDERRGDDGGNEEDQDDEKIRLALARVPATNPDSKIGTIFVNPGGPGGSGVGLVLAGFGEFLSTLTGGRFDVVGFDPRGVAASTPIRCFDTNAERNAIFAGAPSFPFDNAQKQPFFDLYNGLTAQCFSRKQKIARHMSTADVVRDLDRLRRAVGDRKLTYLGFSYGSYIGNTYANLFPRKVRALVIDGVLNPRLWSAGLQILSDRVATQEVFDEFLRLCDEAGTDCALGGPSGANARFQALADAIRAEPFIFADGSVYSYDALITDATISLYVPSSWGGPEGIAAFFDLLADAVLGDVAAAEAAREVHASLVRRWEAAHPRREETYNNGLEAYFGNHCSDARYPRRFPAWSAVADFAERGSPFGPYWWWFNASCASWPEARDRYAGPWRTRTSAPVLIVGNFFDPATDYAGAVTSRRFLKNSRLLSYAGWGHTAFGQSACVTEHVVEYLVNQTLPPKETVCPANPNPFIPKDPVLTTQRVAGTSSGFPLLGLPPAILRPTRIGR